MEFCQCPSAQLPVPRARFKRARFKPESKIQLDVENTLLVSLDITLFTTRKKDLISCNWEFGLCPEKDSSFDSVGREKTDVLSRWEHELKENVPHCSQDTLHCENQVPTRIWSLISHYGGGQSTIYQTFSLPSWAQMRNTFPRSLCSLCCVTRNVNGGDVCSSPLSEARCQCQGHPRSWIQPGSVGNDTKCYPPPPSTNWQNFALAKNTVLKCSASHPEAEVYPV